MGMGENVELVSNGTKSQYGKMNEILETDGDDVCKIVWIYLLLLEDD